MIFKISSQHVYPIRTVSINLDLNTQQVPLRSFVRLCACARANSRHTVREVVNYKQWRELLNLSMTDFVGDSMGGIYMKIVKIIWIIHAVLPWLETIQVFGKYRVIDIIFKLGPYPILGKFLHDTLSVPA